MAKVIDPLEEMTHEELMKFARKQMTLAHMAKAELEGQKKYNETLNNERRPVALENNRLKKELEEAHKRYESLKARVKAEHPNFRF